MESAPVFTPIGIVHSCFGEKFGIPRQPGLVEDARATLEILPPYDHDKAFAGLEAFSHIWVVFLFHAIPQGKWRPTVRPPRLGGNRRVGLFATRSGFRPNPIGISVVRLAGIGRRQGRLQLALQGVDLLDQTPVLDIKPYLPYADAIPDALGGFAAEPPRPSLAVAFTDQSQHACVELEKTYPGLSALIVQVLQADPRPAYMDGRSQRTAFGLRLYDVNVRWTVGEGSILVGSVERG
jgi:tRNA (adenine37-N6)-methyltransferase